MASVSELMATDGWRGMGCHLGCLWGAKCRPRVSLALSGEKGVMAGNLLCNKGFPHTGRLERTTVDVDLCPWHARGRGFKSPQLHSGVGPNPLNYDQLGNFLLVSGVGS